MVHGQQIDIGMNPRPFAWIAGLGTLTGKVTVAVPGEGLPFAGRGVCLESLRGRRCARPLAATAMDRLPGRSGAYGIIPVLSFPIQSAPLSACPLSRNERGLFRFPSTCVSTQFKRSSTQTIPSPRRTTLRHEQSILGAGNRRVRTRTLHIDPPRHALPTPQ
jgi:hypothetical protein